MGRQQGCHCLHLSPRTEREVSSSPAPCWYVARSCRCPGLCTHQNPVFRNTGRGNNTLAALQQGGASKVSFPNCTSPTGQVCTLLAEGPGRKLFASHFKKKKRKERFPPSHYEERAKAIWPPVLCPLTPFEVAPEDRLCLCG